MGVCINKSSAQYLKLQKASGIPEFILEAVTSEFLEKHDRFPNLDELPGADSREYLKQALKVRKDGSAKISDIIEFTKNEDIKEINKNINDLYRDVEINIQPLNKDAIINIKQRPSLFKNLETDDVVHDNNINSTTLFNGLVKRLGNLYGINFKTITNKLLMQDKWRNKIPEAMTANAFVYNGDVYINTDVASVDAPIHEMMHIFLGSMRYTNPNLYFDIVSTSEQFPSYKSIASNLHNRTRMDIAEEVFVKEFSKYIVGKSNTLENLDDKIKYELFYNVNRMLDTVLFGNSSVNSLQSAAYNMNLRTLSEKLNSALDAKTFSGTIDLRGSEIHRIMANTKLELMEQNKLKEYCN